MGDLRFILGSTFMTVGDEVLQQVCGVPMGLSCSPMVSVMMLAWHEISMLERMATAAAGQLGSLVDTPQGRVALTPRSRDALVGLACRISRCCRAIDDVLLIDLNPAACGFATPGRRSDLRAPRAPARRGTSAVSRRTDSAAKHAASRIRAYTAGPRSAGLKNVWRNRRADRRSFRIS